MIVLCVLNAHESGDFKPFPRHLKFKVVFTTSQSRLRHDKRCFRRDFADISFDLNGRHDDFLIVGATGAAIFQ